MRSSTKPSLLLFVVLLLSACSGTASATPDAALQDVYTAAAMTLAVQAETPTTMLTSMPTIALPTTQLLPTIDALPTSTTAPNLISYSSVSTANGCNNAIYVSDVTIADGTILTAGEEFTKTWDFQNTGTCDWNEDYLIVFLSGSQMSGETTELDQEVASGETGDVSVSLIAPSTAGTYTGYWSLATSDGTAFGQSVYVQIVVSSSATTTATATSTTGSSEATSTLTATNQPTSTFTATSEPAISPSETPIPTLSE